ncbi:Proline-rich membrane anchor 1, partial [Varanus komodoensis]
MGTAAKKLKDTPGGKAMANLDTILKSRDITLPTKVRTVKTMVFLVAMYGCESWTIRKAEHRRIEAFELWCWRRLLRVPWTARRSNRSVLEEINPDCSLEGQILKMKLKYFGHLITQGEPQKSCSKPVAEKVTDSCQHICQCRPPPLPPPPPPPPPPRLLGIP